MSRTSAHYVSLTLTLWAVDLAAASYTVSVHQVLREPSLHALFADVRWLETLSEPSACFPDYMAITL